MALEFCHVFTRTLAGTDSRINLGPTKNTIRPTLFCTKHRFTRCFMVYTWLLKYALLIFNVHALHGDVIVELVKKKIIKHLTCYLRFYTDFQIRSALVNISCTRAGEHRPAPALRNCRLGL